jgi:hypothetical protein
LGKLVDEMKRVVTEAELYMDLIVPEDEVRACFELVDTGEAVTIVLKEEPDSSKAQSIQMRGSSRPAQSSRAYCGERPTSSASRPEPR